jgi:hypothetical protein
MTVKKIDDSSIELMKWIGLILMTIDHINAYYFHYEHHWMFALGRLVMPIFVFVLAYNLARPEFVKKWGHLKTANKMLFFGLLSMPVFHWLRNKGGVEPNYILNIMFILLTLTLVIWLIEKSLIEKNEAKSFGWVLALMLTFLIGGALAEYWWGALLLGLAVWSYYRFEGQKKKTTALGLSSLLFFIGVFEPATVFYMSCSAFVIYGLTKVKVTLPRLKWAFYSYYPAHLTLLWAIVGFPIP